MNGLRRLFDRLGNTKTRTLLIVAGVIVLVVFAMIFTASREMTPPEVAADVTPAQIGEIGSLPGTGEYNEEYAKLQLAENQRLALEAQKTGQAAIPRLINQQDGSQAQLSFGQEFCAECVYDAQGYDQNGFDAKGFDAEGFNREGYDQSGFNREGFNKEGFDRAGYNKEGFDPEGYDREGYNAAGLDRDGYDREGYDQNGYDILGYDRAGFNKEGYDRNGFNKDGVDKDGFNRDGYDAEGYNREGYNAAGYDRNGCNQNGLDEAGNPCYDAQGYNAQGYDKFGYDRQGFDRSGYDREGYNKEGFNSDGCNRQGLDALGNPCFNADGYNVFGFNSEGYDREGYNKEGFNSQGYDREGYDREGYSQEGFNREGFDREGYNKEGYDREGFNREGYNKEGFNREGYDKEGYNKEGFNKEGYNREGYDKQGYDRTGFDKSGCNRNGFDRNGQPCVPLAGAVAGSGLGGAKTPEEAYRQLLAEQQRAREAQLTAEQRAQERAKYAEEQKAMQQAFESLLQSQSMSVVTEWNPPTQTYVRGIPPTVESAAGAGAGGAAGAASTGPVLYKAGSIVFAVIDTALNSDEPGPVLATIVQGPLQGSKVIGDLQLVDKKLILRFSLLSSPDLPTSVPFDAVAIDAETARTAIATGVDNHYFLRYGTLFASAFLEGIGEAILAGITQPVLEVDNEVLVVQSADVTTGQALLVGAGTIGQKWGEQLGDIFDKPPTVTVDSGTGVGLLFMKDFSVTEGSLNPISAQPELTKAGTNSNASPNADVNQTTTTRANEQVR